MAVVKFWQIIHGDARHIPLADKTVQTVVTSPPYWGLRDYNLGPDSLGLEPTSELYVYRIVEIFHEVKRVLKDDGTLWLNMGDSYASGDRSTYRSGVSDNLGHLVQNNMLRPKTQLGPKPKDLVGMPWRVAFALQADGWWLRSDIIWSKPNPMPESVTDRPTKSHEYLFLLTKSERYYYDQDAVREPMTYPERIYSPNTDDHKTARLAEQGNRCTSGLHDGRTQYGDPALGRNRRTVWEIATQPFPEAHFATFPEALVEPCIKAGSRSGDIVLDPFAGSGTVGIVALKVGRSFVGIELQPDYIAMAQRRIENDAPLFNRQRL